MRIRRKKRSTTERKEGWKEERQEGKEEEKEMRLNLPEIQGSGAPSFSLHWLPKLFRVSYFSLVLTRPTLNVKPDIQPTNRSHCRLTNQFHLRIQHDTLLPSESGHPSNSQPASQSCSPLVCSASCCLTNHTPSYLLSHCTKQLVSQPNNHLVC